MTLQTLVRNKYRLLYFATGIGVIIFVLSVASCSGNEKEQQKENTVSDDSVQTLQSIASEDSMMIFNNRAENWISRSIQKNNIDWNRFNLDEFWSDDSLQKKSFEPEKEFYKDYAQVLRWSPDSNYILDFGSYGSVKVKDKEGNTRIEGGEPDTEVSMIYPKEKSLVNS